MRFSSRLSLPSVLLPLLRLCLGLLAGCRPSSMVSIELPVMLDRLPRSCSLIAAAVLSLGLHGLALVLLVSFSQPAPAPTKPAAPASGAAGLATSTSAGPDGPSAPAAELDSAAVRQVFDDRLARARKMPTDAQLDQLEVQARQLQAVADEAVDAAASALEASVGVNRERVFEPNSDATGAFDPRSASVYDVSVRSVDGKTIYRWVYVDSVGRTLTHDVPADAMAREDLVAFRIFEAARGNAKLRRLVDAARRIAEARLKASPRANAASADSADNVR